MDFKKKLILTAILLKALGLLAQGLEEKIDSLNQASFELRTSNRELSNALSKEAILLNFNNAYAVGLHLSYLNLGINCTNLNRYDSAFLLLRRCEQFFKDDHNAGLTQYYLGINYSNIRDFKNATKYFERAKRLFEASNSKEFLAQVQNSLGIVAARQASYDQSLKCFLDAYQIRLSNDLSYDQELTNISIVYRLMGEMEKSLEFVRKSLGMSIELRDTLGIAQNYISLGQSFGSMDMVDSAMLYYQKAYSLAKSKQYTHQMSSSLLFQASMLNKRGRSRDAISVLLKGLAISKFDEAKAESLYSELASNYYHISLIDSALYYGRKAYQLTLNADNLGLSKSLSLLLSDIFHDQGKPDSTVKYLKLHVAHLKELNEKSNESLNSDLRVRIETLEKDHEISLLIKENEVKSLRVERLVAGFASLVVFLIALMFWNRSRSRKKELERKKLEMELEKGKEDLYKQTLHMIHINNCLDDIEKEVGQRNEQDVALSNKRIMNSIRHNKSLDKDWQNFNAYFGAVHQDFYDKLTQLSGDLTNHDRRVCALLKLELTNREIATILNIEAKSVAMVKYRIKKKLNLNEDTELDTFIKSI